MTPALKSYIEARLDKAEHDLMSAQRLLEIEPMILDTACFHCQQAVEKYLKAFLIFCGEDVERTHSVTFLLTECSKYDLAFAAIEPLGINAYAVRGRYPDENLMPSKEEAKGYYQLALQVKSLVTERIIFS